VGQDLLVDLVQAGLQGGQQGRVKAVEEQLLDQGGVARSSPAQRLPPLRGSDEARRYTEATGRAINPDALTFYRIRWTLDDLAAFTQQLRAGPRHTQDAAEARQALKDTVAAATCEAAAR
jgi:hypothetical protein